MADQDNQALAALTADIVAAYVTKNHVAASDLAALVTSTHRALAGLSEGAVAETAEASVPAVSVRKSITADHIVCLEDGKPFKSLRRHLATEHGMTPAEYRAKWGLKADYPMVHPAYAESRRSLALTMGLGRKAAGASDAAEPSATAGKRGAKPEGGKPARGRPPRASA